MAHGSRWHVSGRERRAAIAISLRLSGRRCIVASVHGCIITAAAAAIAWPGTASVGRAIGISGRLLRLLAAAEEVIPVEKRHFQVL